MEFVWKYSVADHKLERNPELLTAYSNQLLRGERCATNVRAVFSYTTRQGILGKRCSVHIIDSQSNTKAPTRKSGLYELVWGTSRTLCFKFWWPRNACDTIPKKRNDDLKISFFLQREGTFYTLLEKFHVAILCYSGQIFQCCAQEWSSDAFLRSQIPNSFRDYINW